MNQTCRKMIQHKILQVNGTIRLCIYPIIVNRCSRKPFALKITAQNSECASIRNGELAFAERANKHNFREYDVKYAGQIKTWSCGYQDKNVAARQVLPPSVFHANKSRTVRVRCSHTHNVRFLWCIIDALRRPCILYRCAYLNIHAASLLFTLVINELCIIQ